MNRRRCYIAAPWWHPSLPVREWNTRRAELLCRLAAAEGFEPVCVHRALMDAGVDDAADPGARARGLEATCATVREIAREKGGAMWGLTLDSLRPSDGTIIERSAWLTVRPNERAWAWLTSWGGYQLRMERAGLLTEWAALVGAPTKSCPRCGAPVVLDKQDAMIVNGRPYTERIEACDAACGWYGRIMLFPGGSPDLKGLNSYDLEAEALAYVEDRRAVVVVRPC